MRRVEQAAGFRGHALVATLAQIKNQASLVPKHLVERHEIGLQSNYLLKRFRTCFFNHLFFQLARQGFQLLQLREVAAYDFVDNKVSDLRWWIDFGFAHSFPGGAHEPLVLTL